MPDEEIASLTELYRQMTLVRRSEERLVELFADGEVPGFLQRTRLQAGMRRTDGISMFMIEVRRKGLTYQPIPKLGTNTQSSSSVLFDDVRVEPHELIGTRTRAGASCSTCSIPSAS